MERSIVFQCLSWKEKTNIWVAVNCSMFFSLTISLRIKKNKETLLLLLLVSHQEERPTTWSKVKSHFHVVEKCTVHRSGDVGHLWPTSWSKKSTPCPHILGAVQLPIMPDTGQVTLTLDYMMAKDQTCWEKIWTWKYIVSS